MAGDLVTLTNGTLALTVARLGAELQSFRASGHELLWDGDPAWWTGRAPLLFPIVGPAPGGVLRIGSFAGQMAQHGFAHQEVFDLIDSDASTATLQLTDTDRTRAQYPFAFALTARFRLESETLAMTVTVENRDDQPLPFGFGFHPAFRWPLPGGQGQPHGVTLANGADPALARIVDGTIPDTRLPSPFSNGHLTLDPTQFDADAMIFPDGAGTGLSYGTETGPRVEFAWDHLPFLAIWTKPGGAPFLCVEPWHGTHARPGGTGDIRERPGTIDLAPGDSTHFTLRITPRL